MRFSIVLIVNLVLTPLFSSLHYGYWIRTGFRNNLKKDRIDDMDIIELNEAFAAQSLAVTRALGIADNDPRVNPNGGAIALGHPLGMSGTRILNTAAMELQLTQKKYALKTMCIGVGQGFAVVIERV